jgi:threonylcarbamoyladenosine tRNA methylthiotransferase MtaB
MRTFSIVTLGCKTNQFESAAMSEKLVAAGYRQQDFEAGADLVLINTCTVTANTDAQSRKLIRRARRDNPQARIVVTGCYAQVDAQTLAELPGVALVLGNQEKAELLQQLADLDGQARVAVADIRGDGGRVALEVASEAQRSRAFLQIQNGCDAFCSYCIIPYARGHSRSVEPAAILEQVDALVAAGHQELVLTGIHIGQYGKDLNRPIELLDLIKQIEPRLRDARLRLGSLEPTELPEELRSHIAASARICPHYHIPLQAGTDRVLKAMNRNYTTEFFAGLLQDLRRRQPSAGIGIDLIVGFPGETDAEFEETYRFVESLPVSYLHVFPYSKRPGTPAASFAGQIPGDVARLRAARMRQLGEEKQRQFARDFVDSSLEVIAEAGFKEGKMRAVADNYLSVQLAADEGLIGKRLQVKINRCAHLGLEGEIASP